MKKHWFILCTAMVAAALLSQGVNLPITSFSEDGVIVWPSEQPNLYYDIEWVSELGDRWNIAPSPYWNVYVTGLVGSAELPLPGIDEQSLFFRLHSYTDPAPPGLQSGEVVRHPPTIGNPYAFYSYFPARAEAEQPLSVCVWPHGGGASSNSYSHHETMASNQLNRLTQFADVYRLPLLVVAMPRIHELYLHSLHPHEACELIRNKAEAALRRLVDFAPFRLPGPYELRVDCFTADQARYRAQRVGGEFLAPRSYVVRTDDPLELM